MTYKIIGDSCLDLTENYKNDPHFQLIPLTLQVEEEQVIDDETFDQKRFLQLVAASEQCPKSACPSPDAYYQAIDQADAEMIFIITLSQHLSGSYNSACVGKDMYIEECGNKKQIEVISSDSASVGQAMIAFKIKELAEKGAGFADICKAVDVFKKEMNTYFVLESLETLRKNGRLTGIQAFFASALNIKPIMGADSGKIIKLDQARGITRALTHMVNIVVKDLKNPEEKVLGIAHCNCPARAQQVKEMILSKVSVKEVYIVDTAGVSTMYANDGGIIIAC